MGFGIESFYIWFLVFGSTVNCGSTHWSSEKPNTPRSLNNVSFAGECVKNQNLKMTTLEVIISDVTSSGHFGSEQNDILLHLVLGIWYHCVSTHWWSSEKPYTARSLNNVLLI